MTCIYYCKLAESPDSAFFDLLKSLQAGDAESVLRYENKQDQWRSLLGRLLLLHALRQGGLWKATKLPLLSYNESGRPYLSDFAADFSISHSGDLVACAFTREGRVGLDLEQIKVSRLAGYRQALNAKEWNRIIRSSDPLTEFFHLWTRKEAVLKAHGSGFAIEPRQVDVTASSCTFKNKNWFISDLEIGQEYTAALASDKPGPPTFVQVHFTTVLQTTS